MHVRRLAPPGARPRRRALRRLRLRAREPRRRAGRRCTFQGTTFRACKLVGVDWTAAARLTAVAFEECDLSRGAFLGMDLRRVAMRRCRAREVVLSEADLTDADLSGTDLTGAQFGRTRLAGADLRRATGYVLHPAENDLRGCRVTLPEAASLLLAFGLVVEAG